LSTIARKSGLAVVQGLVDPLRLGDVADDKDGSIVGEALFVNPCPPAVLALDLERTAGVSVARHAVAQPSLLAP
jgi:hypothetical protein